MSLPDVDVLVIMVTNEAQAENALYGDSGAVSGAQVLLKIPFLFSLSALTLHVTLSALPSGASIILSSTVSPSFVSQLERRLQSISSVSRDLPCYCI